MNKPTDDEFLGLLMLKGFPTDYEPMMVLEHFSITADLGKLKLVQVHRRWWDTRGNSNERLSLKRKGDRVLRVTLE